MANLPHTYQLTSINLDDSDDDQSQETYHRDVCWYRRRLSVEATPGQRVFLEFEGAKQLTDLWVNGRHVGTHAISGDTPFHFDITDFVAPNSDNLIALRLENRKTDQIPPDGHRWDYILFGGLYRDVYLVVTDPLHVTFPWEKREAGVSVTTPSVSARNATVSVRTSVRNAGAGTRETTAVTRMIDADNIVVMKLAESGMNIVRLAHYPHDDSFFDACDALGILIAEEPPSWIEFGPPIWMDRLEESFRRTIRNHRNHPSAWTWGAGINHRGPVKRLHYAAKEEDPTRITMNNGTVWTGP